MPEISRFFGIIIMIHLVKQIVKVEPYQMVLLFNTGEKKTIDLSQKLVEWSKSEHSKYKSLLDPDYFKSVKHNAELETIYWDNGIDFCPDTLYGWGN